MPAKQLQKPGPSTPSPIDITALNREIADSIHGHWHTSEMVCKFLPTITPRKLQWWDEKDIMKPRQKGHRRSYSGADLIVLCFVAAIRKRKISLQGTRKAIRSFQAAWYSGRPLTEFVVVLPRAAGPVESRSHVVWTSEPRELLEILFQAPGSFALPIAAEVKRMAARITAWRNRYK